MKLLILEDGSAINRKHIVGVWKHERRPPLHLRRDPVHGIEVETVLPTQDGETHPVIECGERAFRDAVLMGLIRALQGDISAIEVATIKAMNAHMNQPRKEAIA